MVRSRYHTGGTTISDTHFDLTEALHSCLYHRQCTVGAMWHSFWFHMLALVAAVSIRTVGARICESDAIDQTDERWILPASCTELVLHSNQMDGAKLGLLVDALIDNTAVLEVWLSGNNIDDTSVRNCHASLGPLCSVSFGVCPFANHGRYSIHPHPFPRMHRIRSAHIVRAFNSARVRTTVRRPPFLQKLLSRTMSSNTTT
jgi:hypothetical protein